MGIDAGKGPLNLLVRENLDHLPPGLGRLHFLKPVALGVILLVQPVEEGPHGPDSAVDGVAGGRTSQTGPGLEMEDKGPHLILAKIIQAGGHSLLRQPCLEQRQPCWYHSTVLSEQPSDRLCTSNFSTTSLSSSFSGFIILLRLPIPALPVLIVSTSLDFRNGLSGKQGGREPELVRDGRQRVGYALWQQKSRPVRRHSALGNTPPQE